MLLNAYLLASEHPLMGASTAEMEEAKRIRSAFNLANLPA
jgi:hypothetical protein